ncbi:MAG: MerR family transcriptional regulator [Bacteroidetes bacterium]|jgi:DNA-binding transcriptional MerR regulator|nr:MerR family transcriptional regulator [Bacteroidota bacterium]MDA1382348.1 MerR family transcriptional regulator [Bacteroidota bacterium]
MPLNKPIQKQYFSISEVAAMLGVNASLLRFWEKEFKQIMPKTNARGKRSYNSNDIEVIRSVYVLVKEKGFTLDGARKALKARKGMGAEIANEARIAAQMKQTDARTKGTEKPVVQEKSRKEAVTILKKIRAELLTLRAEIKS